MKIKTRYNLTFTLLSSTIILFFAVTIYFLAAKNREKEYFSILKSEAIIKGNLYADEAITSSHIQDIYRQQENKNNLINVAIYDVNRHLLYQDQPITIPQDSIQSVWNSLQKNKNFKNKNKTKYSIGFPFQYDDKEYFIIASGQDIYGHQEMYQLRITLVIIALSAIILLYVLGHFLSKRLVRPIIEMSEEINKITAAHLDLRLKPLKHKDELNQLGEKFNLMLDRLENSFGAQKEFVAHISHELRTPLAAMITDLELAMDYNRTDKEYRDTIKRSLDDAKKIVTLSNNLLDLAKANYEPQEIGYMPVRVDEILLEAYQEIQTSHNKYSIQIEFETENSDDHLITVMGNPYLLKVACKNLIENACKFSENHKCIIKISDTPKMVKVAFMDTGMGISDEELDHIFTTFYRGKNQTHYSGYGIGLPLTKKILHQHNGKIKVETKLGSGSTFTLSIPHLSNI